MSFIKDLIAWKSRPERQQADEEFEAEAWDEGEWEEVEDWDEEDQDEDDEDDPEEDDEFGVLDAEAEAGADATEPAQADDGERPPRMPQPVAGGGEVDEILARVAQRSARAPESSTAKPSLVRNPPKIWEMNATPGAPAAAAPQASKPTTRPLEETPRHAPMNEPRSAPLPYQAPQASKGPTAPPATVETRPRGAGAPAMPAPPQPAEPPARPMADARPAGRVKTRLLGFQAPEAIADPFAAEVASASAQVRYPTGWLVVTDGPGRGACFTLMAGVSQIGRGEDQSIRLNFGDQSISRQNHAAIAYDDECGRFYLGHGGKMNLVRLNGRPVLSTEELNSDDIIRIGETTLKFVAFCGPDFSWSDDGDEADGGEPGRDAAAD